MVDWYVMLVGMKMGAWNINLNWIENFCMRNKLSESSKELLHIYEST